MAREGARADAAAVIRVAIVDDHHAVRLGLAAALAAEPDMEPVGAATCAAELAPLLYRTAPDVVVLDYRLPDGDGLTLCCRLKRAPLPPAVVLHSAFADEQLVVCALVAGADAVVHKGAPGRELAEAIRAAAAGRPALPPLGTDVVRAGAEAVDPEDVPILSLLVQGSGPEEISGRLHLDLDDLRERQDRMLAALRAPPSGRLRDRGGRLGSTPHGSRRIEATS